MVPVGYLKLTSGFFYSQSNPPFFVSILTNGNSRAIRIPGEMDFEGGSELEIQREGNMLILNPVRPTWGSLKEDAKVAPDFL